MNMLYVVVESLFFIVFAQKKSKRLKYIQTFLFFSLFRLISIETKEPHRFVDPNRTNIRDRASDRVRCSQKNSLSLRPSVVLCASEHRRFRRLVNCQRSTKKKKKETRVRRHPSPERTTFFFYSLLHSRSNVFLCSTACVNRRNGTSRHVWSTM
jgi:hypothetical protein